MEVQRIYINTHRYDIPVLRTCISSVRYWYPEIPITLIVDHLSGPVRLKDLCKKWALEILETKRKKFGWGFGKFEPLFLDTYQSFLILDSDTVLTGPILEKIQNIETDFIVDNEKQLPEKVKTLYYDIEKVKEIFPAFEFPGYTFNTGQWFGKSNILSRNDFQYLVDWTNTLPMRRYPDFFMNGDQGVFNFLLQQKESENIVSVEKTKIMIWPAEGGANFIDLKDIKKKEGKYPYIIHWAGIKHHSLKNYPRADILAFYSMHFYKRYSGITKIIDSGIDKYLELEKKIKFWVRKVLK